MSPTNRFLGLLCLTASLCLMAATQTRADTIPVKSAELRAEDDNYVLNAQFDVAFNPTLDIELAGPGKSQPPDFAPSLKVSRTVTDWAALGLEYYADLGPITDIKPYGRQMRALYVAIDVDRAPWAFNFGIGRGLSKETDAWTIKMIFEIPID